LPLARAGRLWFRRTNEGKSVLFQSIATEQHTRIVDPVHPILPNRPVSPDRAGVKLGAIQGLRAFAALLVVVHHGQAEVAALAERAGLAFAPVAWLPWSSGVDVFFVISGFIIVYASAPFYGRAGGRARFLAHRIARLVPLYWLVSALYLAVALAVPALLNGGPATPGTVAAAFLFWPVERPDGLVLPLYGLGWTLNCEMFFYAVFAVGLGWGRGRAVAWACAVLLGLVALAGTVPGLPTPLAFWGSPIVLEFAFGAALGLARAHGLRLSPPARLALAAAVVALGDASYALYLVHPFVLRATREAVARLGLAPVIGPWGALALMLAFSVAAALVVARCVEAPLTRAARRRLDPESGRLGPRHA
jgi:peptidoglycan/LPS O-acetylase OafA/YrhL